MWGGGYLLPGRILRSDYRVVRSRVRVASAYVLGPLLPLLVLFVVVPWFGSHAIFLGHSFFFPLMLLGVSALAGGALTGQLLAVSVRSRFALAVAHGLGLWPIFGVVATLPALIGNESIVALVLRFIPAFAISYLLIGGLSVFFAGYGWKHIIRFAGIGLVSGVAGAAVLTCFMSVVTDETSSSALWLLSGNGSAMACLVSSGIVGWWGYRSL